MKTILWNVDTQYDFMRENGSYRGLLPVPDAQSIEPALARVVKAARERGLSIVHTGDWHTPDSEEISAEPDFVNTFPPHCLMDSKGAEFVPATSPRDAVHISWTAAMLPELRREIVIYKDAFDVFAGNPYTDVILNLLGPDRIVVIGVATNVCVHHAVVGMLERGMEVIVVADAIKELPIIPLDPLLEQWSRLGARFVSSDSINQVLEGLSAVV